MNTEPTKEEPTRTWICDNCNQTVERFRGESDVQCNCGQWFNCFGQKLRDDWMNNPSNYDDEIGDLEGFEIQQLRNENE